MLFMMDVKTEDLPLFCFRFDMEGDNQQYAPRVTQLDAVNLDGTFITLIKTQLQTAMMYWKLGYWNKFLPEIEFALSLIIWKFSVIRVNATIGQRLLGLKFEEPIRKRKLWLLFACTNGAKWATTRLLDLLSYLNKQNLKQRLSRIFTSMSLWMRFASLVNFLFFLRNGNYVTLPQLVLHLRSVADDPTKARTVGYTYVMRELVWHGFADFIMFILPFVNFQKLKNVIKKTVTSRKEPGSGKFMSVSDMKPYETPMCKICDDCCVAPFTMGCGHTFCYYCITANIIADEQFSCPDCSFVPGSKDALVPLL